MGMTEPTQITEQWDHRYDTNANAESVEQRHAESVLAIRIEHGHLRGSDFAGIFELAEVPDPFNVHSGELRVECKVAWFGMKPKNTWSNITIKSGYQLLGNYTGLVTHNLAKKS
jgi:hypothetical protein